MSNNILILTGNIQTGKTSLLQQFCRQQKSIAGILTPVVNNRRMFYDIAAGLFFDMEAAGNEEHIAIGKYFFSAAAFTRAGNILLEAGKAAGISYLIIDEIGPLEIKKQLGLYQPLIKIINAPFTYTLIIVIRKALADEATAILKLNNPMVLGTEEMAKYLSIV